jgi:5'-nucleotidase
LRNVKRCDLVIALTHMRVPNDRILCEKVPELDFDLGGHDHIIFSEKVNSVHILKSGSNFYNYSVIDIYPKTRKCTYECHNFGYELQILKVDKNIGKYDEDLKKYVDEKLNRFKV